MAHFNGEKYPFDKGLLKTKNIQQFENFKLKKQFSNIVVRNPSSFSKLATEHNLIIEKAMKLSLKNLE